MSAMGEIRLSPMGPTAARILKHASLVYAETPAPTFELLRAGQADTWASTLPGL